MLFACYPHLRAAPVAAVLLLLSVPLGGCATSPQSSLMDAHAEAPTPAKKDASMPAKKSGYLPVEDLPPPRQQATMTPDERAKMQKELTAARDRQAETAKAQAAQ
ncbi:hypothetical protein IC762_18860 [Bradyrhizobium genosp. L]|nr:hypothetical protein IC762_18860 [Bradyrhizobium genosp. L]